MGRASRRKQNSADTALPGVHERIAQEAQRARSARSREFSAPDEFPALDGLMKTARQAIEASTPESFTYQGRRYWCRVSVQAAWLEVFSSQATAQPLASAIFGSSDTFGHAPAH